MYEKFELHCGEEGLISFIVFVNNEFSLWGCIVQAIASLVPAAQMLVREGLGRPPVNHVFSWIGCTFKHTRAFAGQF